MRRNAIGITLALALTVGATSVAAAQGGNRPERPRAAQDSNLRRGPGGGGGPDAMLLRGITLTKDQQERVAALRAGEREKMAAAREKMAAGRERMAAGRERGERGVRGGGNAAERPARGMRQRGDTAGMAERRAQMEKRQTERVAALRSILTAEQRTQFDRNVAELKARRAGQPRRADQPRRQAPEASPRGSR